MLDWLDAIPNLGVPGVTGVQPQVSAGLSGTPAELHGVPGVPEGFTGTPGTPAGTPAPVHKLLINKQEHREHLEHRNSQEDGAFQLWRSGLARLPAAPPRFGLEARRWGQLLADADWLLDNFGEQAARDGWSALDLFGVLPGRDAWGGIADRLQASRSLVMGADVARWRRVINGEPESFARGLGGTVPMIALWECE